MVVAFSLSRGSSMTRITLDASASGLLAGVSQPVEVCDQDGTVLGCFVPSNMVSGEQWEEPPLDYDELRRRLDSKEWYTTAEVLKRLEQA
jgi:hypothetical protein